MHILYIWIRFEVLSICVCRVRTKETPYSISDVPDTSNSDLSRKVYLNATSSLIPVLDHTSAILLNLPERLNWVQIVG